MYWIAKDSEINAVYIDCQASWYRGNRGVCLSANFLLERVLAAGCGDAQNPRLHSPSTSILHNTRSDSSIAWRRCHALSPVSSAPNRHSFPNRVWRVLVGNGGDGMVRQRARNGSPEERRSPAARASTEE